MSSNQNTPCGCRCNSANDTLHQPRMATGEFTPTMIHPVATVDLLVTVLGEISNSISKGLERGECGAYGVGVGGDSVADIDARGLSQEHRAGDLEVLSLCIADVLFDVVKLCQQVGVHSSSPVVAESGAGTPDAPIMTVQEGGGSSAAPGVEGPFSPVPSTPRFIAVGDRLYDSWCDRFRDVESYREAQRLASLLQAKKISADFMSWEDAK